MLSPTIYKMCTFFSPFSSFSLVRCLVAFCIWTLVCVGDIGLKCLCPVSGVRVRVTVQSNIADGKHFFMAHSFFVACASLTFFPVLFHFFHCFWKVLFLFACTGFFSLCLPQWDAAQYLRFLETEFVKKHFQRVHKQTSTFMVKYTFFAAK